MALIKPLKDFLDSNEISYEVIEHGVHNNSIDLAHELGLQPSQWLRSVILEGDNKTYMAVLPASYLFDYEVAKRLLEQDIKVAYGAARQNYYKDCQPGSEPAVPELYGHIGIIDESVNKMETVYIDSGSADASVKVTGSDCQKLFASCETMSFACGADKLYSGRNAQQELADTVNQFTPIRIKQRIDETFDLPAMPDIAQDIMKLRVDPSADAKKLGQIVAKDPSLAAQIISWASSPYYGYKGTIDSVETAISRVLGFDLVMNLALGISIGKSLNVSDDGPLGVTSFWRQAVYSASLVEKLCMKIGPKQRPERGLAYLSGLLHNFGHLLLGHLFPPQFLLVNRYIEANPGIKVEDIEHFVIGVT
ncbi:MAG: HDOD domain-containing protein, partial [Kangiellaceae bacterium]|nr:HDOD domain-containing protein [Kangiellaceae bacterium]